MELVHFGLSFLLPHLNRLVVKEGGALRIFELVLCEYLILFIMPYLVWFFETLG
jgi:hypothetical protein